jgi:AcrR family transcriptional regulator
MVPALRDAPPTDPREAAAARLPRRDNRRQRLLDAAARQFRERGYSAASMRDIAGNAGMLAGSAYYHFPSKEELLVAVHEEGIRRITGAVERALLGLTDPWARLEAAAAAHLEALLNGGDYAQVVIRDLPRDAEAVRPRLIGLRDAYEDIFRHLVADVPLPADVDRRLLRLMLLGALNWSPRWYRAGGVPPTRLAQDFIAMLRRPLGPSQGANR